LRIRTLAVALVTALLAAVPVACASGDSTSAAGTPTPPGFVGVDLTAPMFTSAVNTNDQFTKMVSSGVESVRVVFDWAAAQPFKSFSKVPSDQTGEFVKGVANVPTNFAATDQVVAAAAARGLTVLPVVIYTPSWDAGNDNPGGFAPPRKPEFYADYLTTLINRYGPHGSFWSAHPGLHRMAIRQWQVWNEEDLSLYWHQPFANKYVKLLRAAHNAIKHADPSAKVVLGALTDYSWQDLETIEKIHGAKSLFDVISVNDFTATVPHEIEILKLVRKAANSYGDTTKPLIASELSWPSAKGKSPQTYDWNTTEAGQARDITAMLPAVAAARKKLLITGFYYFTWIGEEFKGAPAFNFAGLVRLQRGSGRLQDKPALKAFRIGALALEHCAKKGTLATRCLKRS
jgi:hypothetical protein